MTVIDRPKSSLHQVGSWYVVMDVCVKSLRSLFNAFEDGNEVEYSETCEAEHASLPNAPHECSMDKEVVVHDVTRPDMPALQIQLDAAALALVELEFRGHVVHVETADDAEYVPVRQSVQVALPVVAL